MSDKIALIRECAAQGMTRKQAAHHVGITYHALIVVAKVAGIEFSLVYAGIPRKPERNADVAAAYLRGDRLKHIAEIHGISSARVSQIVANLNLPLRRTWQLLRQAAS